MYKDRIRHTALESRIMSAEQAATLFRSGMTVGMSGFTKAGDCKALPEALAQRAREDGLRVTAATAPSPGNGNDGIMAQVGRFERRMPFHADATLCKAINSGRVMFMDQHLSETVEQLRCGHLPGIDVAVVEAVAIREDGSIVPTTSVGNTASFVQQARKVIVELNLAMPLALEDRKSVGEGKRGERRGGGLSAAMI